MKLRNLVKSMLDHNQKLVSEIPQGSQCAIIWIRPDGNLHTLKTSGLSDIAFAQWCAAVCNHVAANMRPQIPVGGIEDLGDRQMPPVITQPEKEGE